MDLTPVHYVWPKPSCKAQWQGKKTRQTEEEVWGHEGPGENLDVIVGGELCVVACCMGSGVVLKSSVIWRLMPEIKQQRIYVSIFEQDNCSKWPLHCSHMLGFQEHNRDCQEHSANANEEIIYSLSPEVSDVSWCEQASQILDNKLRVYLTV